MADSQQNRFRILLDTWQARIGSVFGWVCMVFWAVIGVYGLAAILSGEAKETAEWVLPFVCFALAFLHFLIIRSARKTKALIADFRLYCAVFAQAPEKSIPDLAASLNIPREQAMARLQEMCRHGYFNGFIDHVRQQMRFSVSSAAAKAGPQPVVYCPGCGARNAVSHPGAHCQYCDAPLNS